MALSNLTTWELRTTGSDKNGGGWVDGASGTDRSQQDAAHCSGSNGTRGGTSTHFIPDGYTVQAADVGNTVQIISGTMTAGFYQIQSINAPGNYWVLDRSPGAGGTAATEWSMGGALLSIGKLGTVALGGNNIWVKAGTYTISNASVNGGANSPVYFNVQGLAGGRVFVIEGYQTTRGDLGTRPVFSLGAAMTGLAIIRSGGNNFWFKNLEVIDNGYASAQAFVHGGSGSFMYRLKFTGSNCGAPIWNTSNNIAVIECYADCSLSASKGINMQSGGLVYNSYGRGGLAGISGLQYFAVNSIGVTLNASTAGLDVAANQPGTFINCLSVGALGLNQSNVHGFVQNTIVRDASAAGYAILLSATTQNGIVIDGMRHYNCASGAYNAALLGGAPTRVTNVGSLSGDPHTNAGLLDYTLNSTAGAGAACQGTGVPTTPLPDLQFCVTYPDYGPLQVVVSVPDYPATTDVRSSVSYSNGSMVGVLSLPIASNVRFGSQYGANDTEYIGTLVSPAVGDVQLGTLYGAAAEYTGTFVVPTEAQVVAGVGYGASGTEFTGTFTCTATIPSSATGHSPADILRWVLVGLGACSDPADDTAWPAYCSNEPDQPDDCVTTYDTTGTDDGRSMTDGEVFHNPGVQVRIRATDHSTGWVKASAIIVLMEQSINQYYIVIGSARYLVHCVTNVGNVIALGKDTSSTKRSLFTINVALNFSPYPLS